MTHLHRTWSAAAARPMAMDLAHSEPSHIHIPRPSRARQHAADDGVFVNLHEVVDGDTERQHEASCS